MYPIVNIILIILSCQCMRTECSLQNVTRNTASRSGQNCYVKSIKTGFDFMPVMFVINTTTPYILHPDQDGNFFFKHNSFFMLSCIGTYFTSPKDIPIKEISVKCFNGFLIYNNKPQLLENFRCYKTPRSRLVMTTQECQNKVENRIFVAGYYSTHGFLTVYKICFNTFTRSPLYTWFQMKTPMYNCRQVTDKYTRYVVTPNFGAINLPELYRFQTKTLEKTLSSKFLSLKYLNKREGRRFLIPCHLTPKNLFRFVFENDVTYFYENTVPQWVKCNQGSWKELEKLMEKTLIRSNGYHIIITGTYREVSFNDTNNVPRTFYLDPPNKIAVPLYLWKMHYDVTAKSGTVYISLNNPYLANDPSVFFCKRVQCPSQVTNTDFKNDLIFCCSKEEFETVYGEIDPQVFKILNS